MKKILQLNILLLIFLAGCSSTPKAPIPLPDYSRLTYIKNSAKDPKTKFKSLNEGEDILLSYLKAKNFEKNNLQDKACELWEEMSEYENFPLHSLVKLKLATNCAKEAPEELIINAQELSTDYLKNLKIESFYLAAKKYQLAEKQIFYGIQYQANLPNKADRLLILQELLSVTRNNIVPKEMMDKIQELIEKNSPRLATIIDETNRFDVAKDFEKNRDFEKSRNLYLEIINNSEDLKERIKSYNAYRTSFKIERKLDIFIEKTSEMELFIRQLLGLKPNDKELQEAWIDAKINYSRAVWTDHNNELAKEILTDALEAKIGTSSQLAMIYWIYGQIHLEEKENNNAVEKFNLALNQKNTNNTDQEENIVWSLVWTYYQNGNYKKQINLTDKILLLTQNHNFYYKLLFWKAKALRLQNKNSESDLYFNEIFQKDEFGFYGILSSMELNLPLSSLKKRTLHFKPSGNLILDWLIFTDEKDLARNELKLFQKNIKSIEDKKKYLPFYYYSEWISGGMNILLTYPQSERNNILKEFLPVFYPIFFEDEFNIAAKKFNVPLAYPLAISRQESNFNPRARSWADAFGLMQVIPEKASEISQKYHIQYNSIEDLYDPSVSTKIGIALLSELRHKNQGKFIQSTASYNASPNVVSKWEKERFNGNYLEFIESIPYEETRNYIKLVFRNYVTYKRILSEKSIILENDFFNKSFN